MRWGGGGRRGGEGEKGRGGGARKRCFREPFPSFPSGNDEAFRKFVRAVGLTKSLLATIGGDRSVIQVTIVVLDYISML